MLTYTPVSEAGGVGKTTTATTLAVSHARAGHDVLAIDMDTQNGSLTYVFGRITIAAIHGPTIWSDIWSVARRAISPT